MRSIVAACRTKADRFVFTASISEHAKRCLERVGVDDLFTCIIDTRTCDLETKHSRIAFEKAMRAANASDASQCMLIDDSVKNIRTAKTLGWTTVLIGKHERDTGNAFTCPEADFHLDDVYDLPAALPHLFPSQTAVPAAIGNSFNFIRLVSSFVCRCYGDRTSGLWIM